MHDWEKFNKTLLPEKEEFYSHLSMENIDADYADTKRVCKDLEKFSFENIVIFMFKAIHYC